MKTMNSSTLVFGLGAIILGALLGFLYQQIVLGDKVNERDNTITTLQTELDNAVKDSQTATLDPANLPEESTATIESTNYPVPLVVFEPGGLFDEGTRKEITKKLVEPYFDFYNESSVNAVSMHIESPDQDPGAWGVFVINADESYHSFFYGSNEFETQDWWNPDCFEGCNFTNTFKAKYPDIVKTN